MTITRVELSGHIAAFRHGPASRNNLLAYAMGSNARPAIVAVIERLPDKTFASIRDLWYELADVPVSR